MSLAANLLEIFQALSSTDVEAANEANNQLLELQASNPEETLFAAAEIIMGDPLPLDAAQKSLLIIKSMFLPSITRSMDDVKVNWNSFPAEKRQTIKSSIIRCLMIENETLQRIAARTLAVLTSIDVQEEKQQTIVNINNIFTDPEQYGEGSKLGVLCAIHDIIEDRGYKYVVLGNPNFENDALIVLSDTLLILEAEEAPLELRMQALDTLITTAKGYSMRNKNLFEDSDIAVRGFQCVVSLFQIDDEKFHIRLYDLLGILMRQKYFEADSIFASIFEAISGDSQNENPNISSAFLDFWIDLANLETDILSNEETAESSPKYIEQITEPLLPVLLSNLTNDTENEESRLDPTFTRPALKVRKLIEAIAQIIPEHIFQTCDEFLKENISGEEWQSVSASLFALQANIHILSRRGEDENSYAYDSLENILPLVDHDSYVVREQVVYIMAEIVSLFKPREGVLPQLLETCLPWLQKTPIDAAATCILIRNILRVVDELPEEAYVVVKDNLFQVIERDDSFEYQTLLDKTTEAFFSLVRRTSVRSELKSIVNATIQGCIERIEQTTATEMEEMKRNKIQVTLMNIAEECIIAENKSNSSSLVETIMQSIDILFRVAESENCINEAYEVIGVFITAYPNLVSEEFVTAKNEFFSRLIPIVGGMLQDESDETKLIGASIINKSFFSCKEQAIEAAPQMLDLLIPLLQNENARNDFLLEITKAVAVLVLLQPESFQEPASIAFTVVKNIRRYLSTEEDYPEVIESACTVYKAYVKAFEGLPVIRPNKIELFSPIQMAFSLPKRTLKIYNVIYKYIHCLVYSKSAKEMNVMCQKPYVKFFFSREASNEISRLDPGLIQFMKGLKNKISRL